MQLNTKVTVKAGLLLLNEYRLKYVEKHEHWALKGRPFLTCFVERASVQGGYFVRWLLLCCPQLAPPCHTLLGQTDAPFPFGIFFIQRLGPSIREGAELR